MLEESLIHTAEASARPSHSIKVESEVYTHLERLRRKRETFSGAVARLLALYEAVNGATRAGIEGTPADQEYRP